MTQANTTIAMRLRISRSLALGMCLAVVMPLIALNSVAQQPFLQYTGAAYGTYAAVGSIINVAQTAPVSIGAGCGTPAVGVVQNGTLASLNVSPLVQTGLINTQASTALNTATGSSDLHQISLLGGMILASEIKSVSTSYKDGTGFHNSAAGSKLVNLLVAGVPIRSIPAPNTTFNLLGFGHVVVNEQITGNSSSTTEFTVNMLHVYVTLPNVLNIEVGTQIIVADAVSGLTEVFGPASLDGLAFGTVVHSTLLSSSPTAQATVGCRGNTLLVKTLAGINVPQVVSSGTITNTAQGSVTTTSSSSQTSDAIQAINVLAGTLSVDAIQTTASASTTDGTTFNFNSSGSFVNLRVAGHSEITDNVPPNTKISLAGIGTLYLHRIIQNPNNIEVRMIEVVLFPNNIFGLPTNLDVIVGDSEASLHSPARP